MLKIGNTRFGSLIGKSKGMRRLLQVLEKNKWKKGCSARELGLTMRTLQRKLKHHGI